MGMIDGPPPLRDVIRAHDAAARLSHDQALAPIRTRDFDARVNVTLALPFIRTSPDHGTEFDIAGQSLARPDSTIAAPRMAKGREAWA